MQVLPMIALRRRSILLRIAIVMIPLIFVVTLLSQNVFAQNTFVITDGEQVIVHTTYASDPALALTEAGVELDPDEYYTTQTEDGVYDITVRRTDAVTVTYRGETKQILIQDDTVEALLLREGIPTGEGYEISQALDAKPVDGMQINVDSYVVNEETYTVEFPFTISTVEDPYTPEGEERIITEGVTGQTLYTATVEYRNAQEVKRTVTNKEVIRVSQNQVVAVGTGEMVGKKADKPLFGEDVIVLPSGEVLTYYKKDTYKATAYTKYDEGCNDTTACMTKVKWGVVAVDTDLIPYGTRMYIVTSNGKFIYGIGTAEDCGGAIQGKRLDLYMPTLREAFNFGRQDVTVYFLGDANWTY